MQGIGNDNKGVETLRSFGFWGLGGNASICRVACVMFVPAMVVHGVEEERIFVSVCSTVYLSNFVAFVESRDIVWRQNYASCFTLKQT
jgi:hypothetical protein